MKVIFLDIDGVLSDGLTILGTGRDIPTDDHLACLKQIVDATGAQIVLSSDWRLHVQDKRDVVNALDTVQLKLFDDTKKRKANRDIEIRNWLTDHPEVENFVILDDNDKFSKELKLHLVLTDFALGLLPEHAELAIEVLNKKEFAIIKPEGTLNSVIKEV